VEGDVEKVFVAKRIAEKLWATEEAVDGAIAEASGLMAGLVEARRELKVSAVVADEATSRIAEAVKAMAEARHAMIEAHKALDDVRVRVGVRVKMDNGFLKTAATQDAVEGHDRRAG
jgi:hypothetical protein